MEVSKTICPVQDYVHAEEADAATTEDLFLEVATASVKNVGFSLVLQQEQVSIRYVSSIVMCPVYAACLQTDFRRLRAPQTSNPNMSRCMSCQLLVY